MAGAQPVVVFLHEWGIHVMVVLSFLVQVTLLLLADIRRRKDWPVLKGIIWSGYTLADATAVYALGHMSVLCRLPEHHLMALWAPLLLVHLGGQDNITAYAIEDNRLWLRHLQTFGVQILGASYVLYASSLFSLPPLLCWATILMSVVGVLKYGERVWSLWSADKYASSSLSATSYKDFREEEDLSGAPRGHINPPRDMALITAYSLLHVPKQMFEGPTRYVKYNNNSRTYTANYMCRVVETQLSMMYDLLYTKAAVVHTRYGVCIRVISLPSTVAALFMFHAMRPRAGEVVVYRARDVTVTNVLLTGAVVLEAMSVLRAVFSMWTVALLSERKCQQLANEIASVERGITRIVKHLLRSKAYWSGTMRQHNLFKVFYHTDNSTGSKIATWFRREDWWDSMSYSTSTHVRNPIISKVLHLVSTAKVGEVGHISRAQGLNAVRRSNAARRSKLVTLIKRMKLELADSILVWHIATNVYTSWYLRQKGAGSSSHYMIESTQLSNYMFFLLAARPYMLPYPVTRQRYVQLCHDSFTQFSRCTAEGLKDAILEQKDALIEGYSLKPDPLRKITGLSYPVNNTSDTRTEQPLTMNISLDKGSQLAATLIHKAQKGNADGIMEMIFEVWVEMLCYTAYGCDEKSHAENLTNGGDIMTVVSLLMVYMSNGFIRNPTNLGANPPIFEYWW